jgi:hypothetical protein
MAKKKKAEEGSVIKKMEHTIAHEVAFMLEKAKIGEYVELMQHPIRSAWLNFWGGLWRGFGLAVGGALLVALFLWGLRYAFHHAGGLPMVGARVEEALGWILEVIDKKQASK